ncbi:hypothetical protein V565_330260, partial [Rhizoctonia solani 123E]
MTATNGRSAAYPYVGAFSSFGNLGSGSNDLFPGSSNRGRHRVFGSDGDARRLRECHLGYDPLTHVIRAQWVNTDRSAPATHLVHARDVDADLILLTGDPAAMRRDYAGDYPEV